MVYKNQNIKIIVLRTVMIDDKTMTIYFSRPIGFEYEAGDWMDLNFSIENPSGGKTYSFSSSPTERELAVTFKVGLSPFKKALQGVRGGEEIFISQFGNSYNFHLQDNRSSVLIGGGIGIAPFRSMLKDMLDTQSKNEVQLIYMNKGQNYVFYDEIESWKKLLPNLSINYIDTSDLNRKKREKIILNIINISAHHYFIAGPEGMVESSEHLLIDSGIAIQNIRIDSFGGY